MDDGDEPARMRHFMRHYLDTLALRRDRCLFALHSNFNDEERLGIVCQDYFKLAIADRVSATGELVGIQAEDRADSLFK
eukprot:jgi/Tetstr1/431397/TSEL_021087.t1